MNDIIYWVWLAQKNGAGRSDAVKLLKHFPGGAQEIYEASHERLTAIKECSESFISRLTNHDLSQAERTLEFCFMNGIRVVSCASPHYPSRLQELYNKPIVLYIRGMIEDLNERFCVSIVGTRSMSGYGKHMAFTLARQLIAYGALIISGAAYGVDSAANSTAVFLEEPTVAVLGSGVNVPYPPKNKELIDWIGAHGMVISEFEPNTPPYGRNFPIRNRIISGLADAVIVVEGGAKSGALITARCAEDQGRMVYAVPGNIGAPNSVGPNSMIRDGAKMVTRAEDIVEDFAERFKLAKLDRIIKSDKYMRYEYNHHMPIQAENMPLSPEEQDKMSGLHVPPIGTLRHTEPLPDIPSPGDYRGVSGGAPSMQTKDSDAVSKDVPRTPAKRKPYSVKVKASNDIGGTPSSIKDERERILGLLDKEQRRVFDAMPENTAVTTDKIAQSGIPTDVVLSSLTMLELFSAVESLPGGLYRKII